MMWVIQTSGANGAPQVVDLWLGQAKAERFRQPAANFSGLWQLHLIREVQ